MAYEKQSFTDGQILNAEHLARIEDGIVAVEENVNGIIDDTVVDTQAWSSKRTVDLLCPNFSEAGPAVVCEPVEGYPLSVVSTIEPSTGGVRGAKLWRGGKNLLDVSAAGLYHSNSSTVVQNNRVRYITRTETGLRIEETADSSGGYGRCGIYLGTVKELAGKTITVDCEYSTSMTTSEASKNIYISSVSVAPANVFEKPIFKDGGYLSGSNFSDLASGWGKSVTYTVTGEEDREYIAILFYPNAGGAYVAGDWAEFNDLQVEIGDAPTAYEPYRGETFTLDFSETVYGGNVEWNTGALTITHGSDGAELTEPYTVQLTPQKILALSGVNTLYSDTGDTEVKGKADPVAVIEKLTNAIIALGGNV